MNLVYLPPWSTKLIAGIALALLVLAAVRWWRESRGGPLLAVRACIIGLLILVMLNPQALLPRERTEKPKLAILLDTSASMATRDLGTDSRLAAALRTLTNPVTLATLNRDFVLDVAGLTAKPIPPTWLNWARIPQPATRPTSAKP